MGEEEEWMMQMLKKGYKRYVEYILRNQYFSWYQYNKYIDQHSESDTEVRRSKKENGRRFEEVK